MNTEQRFLVTYGLQNFVSYDPASGRHAFHIDRDESAKMIDHARMLIQGNYGDEAVIRII